MSGSVNGREYRMERLEAMTNLMCGNVRDFMEDFK